MENTIRNSTANHAFPREYESPRELEHPLHPIQTEENGTLVWIQPRLMRPAYELWSKDKVIATLRYRGLFYPEALAVSSDGLWTIERTDGSNPLVYIRRTGRIVGTFSNHDHLGGILKLNSERIFLWVRQSIWTHEWAFLSENGSVLEKFSSQVSLQARLRVHITPEGFNTPEASLLALLGKYLMLARSSGKPLS